MQATMETQDCLAQQPDPDPPITKTEPPPPPNPVKRKRNKKSRKIPGYPKHPKNGYVRFCDFFRPIVCTESPTMDPVEVTKLVAQKWYSLTLEEKQPYLEAAKLDADRFKKEVEVFKTENPEEGAMIFKRKRKSKKQKASEAEALALAQSSSAPSHTSKHAPKLNGISEPAQAKKEEISFIAGLNCELPIFTDSFLDHNKAAEADLKILRKSTQEVEQQNSILMKHIENMENGVSKVEGEVLIIAQQNKQLELYLSKLKYQLAHEFHTLPLPSIKSSATMENITEYMTELSKEVVSMKDPSLVNKARDIMRKCNMNV